MTLADGSLSGGAAAGLVIIIGLYFVPTIVAAIRHVPNVGSVIVINTLLGWSIIGWIIALAMAARSSPQPVAVHQYNHPISPPTQQPAQAPAKPAGPPPGWYNDPSGAVRWWNGEQWTEQTRPS